MKIKRKLILLAMLFTGSLLFAQNLDFEKVCDGLASHPIMTGDFSQVKTAKTAKGTRELKSSGKFIICMDGIVWKNLKPLVSTTVIGKNSITKIAGDGTATVSDTSKNPVFENVAVTVLSIFSNDYTKLNEAFTVAFIDKGEGSWASVLTPKDSTIASVMGELLMEGKCEKDFTSLTSLKLTDPSGNSITYTFANQNYPKELTADEKAFFVSK